MFLAIDAEILNLEYITCIRFILYFFPCCYSYICQATIKEKKLLRGCNLALQLVCPKIKHLKWKDNAIMVRMADIMLAILINTISLKALSGNYLLNSAEQCNVMLSLLNFIQAD